MTSLADPILSGFTAYISRTQAPESSIKVGSVAVGRDGKEFLLRLRDHEGLELTARLSGYFFDRFAHKLADLAEEDVNAGWRERTEAATTLRPLCRSVAAEMGMGYARLLGPGRERPVSRVRFAACWVARHATQCSLPQIARHVGYEDHSSVHHALNQAEALRATDAEFRAVTDKSLALFRRPAA